VSSWSTSAGVISFGEFEADLRSRELRRNGDKLRLPDQAFLVLAVLLERRGELVTREEIHKKLWASDTFVDFDHGLNNAVNRLREVLGDSADSPRFVETLPRRGYRFIAPVKENGAFTIGVPSAIPSLGAPATRKWAKGWPIAAYAACLLFVAAFTFSEMHMLLRSKPARITSLVVLPLENISGDHSQDYFADGMTDTLITDLAGLSSVRVISRTSAMHYKGSHESLPDIARELHVDAVVEGTVSREGNLIRINAQLIDAQSDRHLWAHEYKSDLRDVLQLQSELAATISEEVAGRLTHKEQSRWAVKPRQVVPEAYDAYLKGEYFLDRWTGQGFDRAKSYFEHSIQLDPGFADGYAGLAEYYELTAFLGVVPPKEAWLKSEELLLKALEMDNTSSKAHCELGMLKLQFRCDRAAAEKELNYALELNPGDMRALDYHSYYLLEIGRTDEAISEKRRVLDHDPVALITNADFGLYLGQAGRTDEAIAQFQKTLELDPNYAAAHMRLGSAYARKQEYSQAVVEMQKGISLDKIPARLTALGEVYARWGKRKEALDMIRQLEQMSKERYVAPSAIALIYARLGDKKHALTWLEKAKPEDDPKISNSAFDSLRSEERFRTLEARLEQNPSCPTF
jgi:TolB-like protein/Tfp pilus assembly protein PilF